MPSWIPAYRLIEGPEETGIPFRYKGVRDTDGATAWIRVDGSDATSRPAADAVARIYAATASFDHPLLPRVLDYESTSVAGRPFIAFQLSGPAAGGGRWPPRGMILALAELQVAALECGLAGLHLPLHELLHLRKVIIGAVLASAVSVAGTAGAETLTNGAGATFPYPLYSKWFSEYAKVDASVKFNYQSIGSGGGIRQLLEGTVDFGASDAPMTDEQLASAKVLAEGGSGSENDPMASRVGGRNQNWAPLALAGGKLLLRDQTQLKCVNVAQ